MLCLLAFYQSVALSGFPELIKYRFFVSRVNKVALASFVALLGFMVYRRGTPAAKFCSGDHLDYSEWRIRFSPHRSKEFLVKMGFILQMYVYAISVSLAGIFVLLIYVAKSVKGLFA